MLVTCTNPTGIASEVTMTRLYKRRSTLKWLGERLKRHTERHHDERDNAVPPDASDRVVRIVAAWN
jgi:hypothetical protein